MESRPNKKINNTKLKLSIQANTILKLLDTENINSPVSKNDAEGKRFDIIRKLATKTSLEMNIVAPGLTQCVATTLLKVGLCQELSQRFILEYILKYKNQNISLIMLSNPDVGCKEEDHMLVILGPVQAPDYLYIGKNTGVGSTFSPKDANQLLTEFLEANKNNVIADPLLHCFGNIDEGLSPLQEYCQKYNLTHVVGVRSFRETPYLVQNAPIIKKNAGDLAEKIKLLMINNETTKNIVQKNYTSIISQGLFENTEIKLLVKKYGLSDASQDSLEKGLRNAATNNQSDDLKVFIRYVDNINAQDTNPKMKRTALHWAAIKGHETCCQLLLEANAKSDVTDANGETASKYLKNTVSVTKTNSNG